MLNIKRLCFLAMLLTLQAPPLASAQPIFYKDGPESMVKHGFMPVYSFLQSAEIIERLSQPYPDTELGQYQKKVDEENLARSLQEMDRYLREWNSSKERLPDGRWQISSIISSLEGEFARTDWAKSYKTIARWKEINPESPAVAISEAVYWQTYAWNARGNGYASTVSPDGWKLFRERLKKAEQTLLESKHYASKNVLWYEVYLSIATESSWDEGKFQKLFEQAIQTEKMYYPFYFEAIRYFSPKWGGNYKLIDQFINHAVKLTSTDEDKSLYTRLYWVVAQQQGLDFQMFKESHASWPLMKKGFEYMMQRYPDSTWNLNNFASFACRAGDGATFSKLRVQIGRHIRPQAWPSNLSLDLCEHKFFKPS